MVFNSLLATELKGTLSGFLVDGSLKKKTSMIYHFMIFLDGFKEFSDTSNKTPVHICLFMWTKYFNTWIFENEKQKYNFCGTSHPMVCNIHPQAHDLIEKIKWPHISH